MKGNQIGLILTRIFLSTLLPIFISSCNNGGDKPSADSVRLQAKDSGKHTGKDSIPLSTLSPSLQIQMKPYNSAKEGFAMDYPATWQLDDTSHPHFVTFLSPLENEEDKFDEAMNVTIAKLQGPITLDKFVNNNLEHLKKSRSKDTITIRRKEDVKIGRLPAKRIEYTLKYAASGKNPAPPPARYLIYVIFKNKTAYTITAVAQFDTYDRYLPIFQQTVESFR